MEKYDLDTLMLEWWAVMLIIQFINNINNLHTWTVHSFTDIGEVTGKVRCLTLYLRIHCIHSLLTD